MSDAKVYDPKQVTLTIDGEPFEHYREIVRRPAGSLGVGAYDDGPVGFFEIAERPTERLVLPVERTSPGEPLEPLPPAAPRCPACGRIDCPTLRPRTDAPGASGADLEACGARRVVRRDAGEKIPWNPRGLTEAMRTPDAERTFETAEHPGYVVRRTLKLRGGKP